MNIRQQAQQEAPQAPQQHFGWSSSRRWRDVALGPASPFSWFVSHASVMAAPHRRPHHLHRPHVWKRVRCFDLLLTQGALHLWANIYCKNKQGYHIKLRRTWPWCIVQVYKKPHRHASLWSNHSKAAGRALYTIIFRGAAPDLEFNIYGASDIICPQSLDLTVQWVNRVQLCIYKFVRRYPEQRHKLNFDTILSALIMALCFTPIIKRYIMPSN